MIEVRCEGQKIVAEIAGNPVGALKFFRNEFHYHPRIYTVAFANFSPSVAAVPIARRLYDRLVQELQPHKPLLLRTGIDEGDAFYEVLRSLGFREYRRVYSPVLDVAAFDLELLKDSETAFSAFGYKLIRLSDLDWTAEVQLKTLQPSP